MNQSTALAVDDESIDDSKTAGWVLSMKEGLVTAVGEMDMIYVFPFTPRIFSVPMTPRYAKGVIVWQQRLVPVLDLGAYLNARGQHEQPATAALESTGPVAASGVVPDSELVIDNVIALFAFRLETMSEESWDLGALLLEKVPERVLVDDDDACDLPDAGIDWSGTAISCFHHEKYGAVPILDLAALFKTSPASAMSGLTGHAPILL